MRTRQSAKAIPICPFRNGLFDFEIHYLFDYRLKILILRYSTAIGFRYFFNWGAYG